MRQEQKRNLLPPIIVDYIDKLNNKTTTNFQKGVYLQMLERVRDACDQELKKHSSQKNKEKVSRK